MAPTITQAPEEEIPETASAPLDATPGTAGGEELVSEPIAEREDAPVTDQATPDEPGAVAAEAEEPVLPQMLSLGGPSGLELAVFCRQWATLNEAGTPTPEALHKIARRTANARLRKALEAAAGGAAAGQAVHEAMAPHSRVFSPLVTRIIRAGEAGGRLEGTLARLAEIMEARARITRRVEAATIYPLTALAVALGVITLILVKAIPTFQTVFTANLPELPRITRLVIDLSNFVIQTWWILLPGLGLGLAGGRWWIRATPAGARLWSWLALHLPVLRGVSRKIGAARAARTLGGLVTAGVPLAEALRVAGETNENALIAEALLAAAGHAQRGERVAEPLAQARVLPPLMVDMIGTGEETGTLDRMLDRAAEIYDAEVDATLGGLASIIEPLLIIVLGGAMILITLAVLLPYFRLAGAIQEQ